MKRFTAIVLVSAFLGFAMQVDAVFAQKNMEEFARSAYKKLLAEVDKNRDGKLSKAEHQMIWKDKVEAEKSFKMWDLNKDGFITEQEYVKAITDMGRKPKE